MPIWYTYMQHVFIYVILEYSIFYKTLKTLNIADKHLSLILLTNVKMSINQRLENLFNILN